MISYFGSIYRRYIYSKVLSDILTIPEGEEKEPQYICRKIEKYNFLYLDQSFFKEIKLFKEEFNSAWIRSQILGQENHDNILFGDYYIVENEYRIYILQTCIEMTKN